MPSLQHSGCCAFLAHHHINLRCHALERFGLIPCFNYLIAINRQDIRKVLA